MFADVKITTHLKGIKQSMSKLRKQLINRQPHYQLYLVMDKRAIQMMRKTNSILNFENDTAGLRLHIFNNIEIILRIQPVDFGFNGILGPE